MAQETDVKLWEVTEHARDEMDPDAAARALSLLARWALRRAQKRAEGEVSKGVTGAFAKGSGSQEAGQLTCYGSPKR